MSFYGSATKDLEATRILGKELALDHFKQQLEREKITKELQQLSHSRRLVIQRELDEARKEYEDKMNSLEKDITEQHIMRKHYAEQKRKEQLHKDIQAQKKRLLDEQRNYDKLKSEYLVLEDKLNKLKASSKISSDNEKLALSRLETRKAQFLELLVQSQKKEDLLLNQMDEMRLRLRV